MSFDNRIFNVNGVKDDMLVKTLELAAMQNNHYDDTFSVSGWKFSPRCGLMLSDTYQITDPSWNRFLNRISIEEAAQFVLRWLPGPEAATVPAGDWEEDPNDSDVDTELGWRVYIEDWGYVDGDWNAFCAVKRNYIWYGK